LATLCRLTEGLARSGLDHEAQARADGELRRVLAEGIAAQRPGRFWAAAAAAQREGLTASDAMFLLRLIVQTGHESTAQAIAGAIHAAVEWNAPFDGAPAAVEEWLRWTTPLIRFARVAVEATTLAGVELERGARVVVLFPVVNRDERVFSQPLQLDLRRAPNPHLSFGAGPHRCLGARLARAQLGLVMQALSDVPRPRLAGPMRRLTSAVTRGFEAVPLAF
jgi:cytochrome P450